MELHFKGETNKYYIQRTHYTQHAEKYQGVICTQRHDTMKMLHNHFVHLDYVLNIMLPLMNI